ncbi:MAG: tetratricopeptide repeat protein [Bacteroidetes bacterium]|nr:tetratricopeptide repeat protein [Bacteroidota bacterium]
MAKSFDKKKSTAPSRSFLYIVTGVNSSNEDEVLTKIQDFKQKLGTDQILVCGKSANESKGIISYDQIAATLETTNASFAAVVPSVSVAALNSIQHSMRVNPGLTGGHIYLADKAADKQTKRSILQRIGLFFVKVFGVTELNGLDSGISVVSVLDLRERNLLDATVLDNSAYRFAPHCIFNGMVQDEIAVRQGNSEEFNYSYFKGWLAAFGSRINWFITEPLKSIKSKGLSGINNGNHSLYRLLFALLCFFSLVLLPYLSFDFGITWDEPEDRKYFTEVISYFQTGGEDTRALDTNRKLHDHLVNYGPFVNLTCAFAEEYISPFDTYETRHFVISLFAFIGLLFTSLLARKAGTWRTGVIALLIMLCTPVFIGHSANNQKDMPFLAFYIASLFYIIRFVQELPKVRTKTFVMTGLTMGILFSIRAGGLIVFPYLVMFVGLKFLWQMKDKSMSAGARFMSYGLKALIPLVIAYIIGVIFWPAAIADPLNHPLQALKNFEKFSLVHVYEIFEGLRYYMKDYPWYYAPKMIYITLPLFVLAGIIISLIGFAMGLITKNDFFKKYSRYILIAMIFTIVFPIAYIIYKDSALYNSWRHVLFVMPGLLILAAVGWDWIISMKQKIVRLAGTVVLAGGMIWVLIWMVGNHPYEYMYYNELVGGVKGAFGNYELDYWCQTPKEAMKWLQENEGLDKNKARVISNNEVFSLIYYSSQNQEDGKELRRLQRKIEDINDDIDRINYYKEKGILTEAEHKMELDALNAEGAPIKEEAEKMQKVNVMWARELQWQKDEWDYAIWTNRTLSPTLLKKGYFPPKGTIHTIDVDGKAVAAIVKRENQWIPQANELMKTQQFDSAEYLLKRYIQYDPLEEEAYRTLSYLYVMKSDWRKAIDYAQKSLDLCPESFYSLHFQGLAYLRMGELDSAEKCFKECIVYKPNFSSGHDGLGDVAMSRNDPNSAIQHYKTAISFMGNNAYVYYKMGEAYLALNDLNNAANHFNASIQTNQNFAESYNGMYKVLMKAGQQDKAMEYYNNYKRLMGIP